MTANFFIKSDSFEVNSESLEFIYERIDDLDLIRNRVDDINEKKLELELEKDLIFKDEDIYGKKIYKDLFVDEFIYGNNEGINANYQKLLRSFIDKSRWLTNELVNGEIA